MRRLGLGTMAHQSQLRALTWSWRRTSALATASSSPTSPSATHSSGWLRRSFASASSSSSSLNTRELRVFNTLTGQFDAFPAHQSHVLKWYACGPTVYDKAHLGHARAYVSQDILRRIMERKFGLNVWLVMGVTDVDDKIIRRAQEEKIPFHQLARREERNFLQDMEQLHVLKPHAITRVSEHMDDIIKYIEQIMANGFGYEASDGSGVYFDTQRLGAQYGKLAPERNPNVFAQGIQPQDLIDIGACHAPSSSEPTTQSAQTASVKKNPRDFSLWKATKEANEPSWASPWGPGRPGWHIECSAMTHHVLGEQLDVHSGGIDLRFPHHNNEIAQCDAHHQCGLLEQASDAVNWQWCRHFIHFGHLYIRGLKMSKSLKNFISIQEFLTTSSSEQFRLFCLRFKYRSNVHYSEDRMRDAQHASDRIRSFLTTAQAYAKVATSTADTNTKRGSHRLKKCHPKDLKMLHLLFATKTKVDTALADDFDTPLALQHVLDLISRCHEYLLGHSPEQIPSEVLFAVAKYVIEVMDLFGVEAIVQEFEAPLHRSFAYTKESSLPKGSASADKSITSASTTQATTQTPPSTELLDCFVQFRALVREMALSKSPEALDRILNECDQVRNQQLVQLGVQVEDLAPGRSIYKLLSKDQRDALEAEQEQTTEAKRRQEQVKELQRRQQKAHEQLMQITPSEFFREVDEFRDAFAEFDADGFPLTDSQGQELSKSAKKKLRKRLDKHRKAYERFWAQRQQKQ